MAMSLASTKGTPVEDFGPRQNFLRITESNITSVDQVHVVDRIHSQTPEVSSKKIKLSKVLENKEYEGAEIEYEYDFGDCWLHRITVIGRTAATSTFKCLDGEGRGVAEDCGSTPGWKDLKGAYRTTSPTQEQKDKRHWFENQATNRDRRGLGNGLLMVWDKDAINANLRH